MMFTKTKNAWVNKSYREIIVSKFKVKRCNIGAVELFNDSHDLHIYRGCMGILYISAYISAINDSNQTTFFLF